MVIERRLSAKDLPTYVAALEGAAKGGKAAATWKELTIIAAGVSQSWEVAKQMYQGGAGWRPRSARPTGDKTTLGSDISAGVSGKLNVKAVSVEAGYSEGKSKSTTATRNKQGGLDVETNIEESGAASLGAGFDAGAAGMAQKGERTFKTSIGYMVTIAAADDPDGKLLAALPRLQDAGGAADVHRAEREPDQAHRHEDRQGRGRVEGARPDRARRQPQPRLAAGHRGEAHDRCRRPHDRERGHRHARAGRQLRRRHGADRRLVDPHREVEARRPGQRPARPDARAEVHRA